MTPTHFVFSALKLFNLVSKCDYFVDAGIVAKFYTPARVHDSVKLSKS